MCGNFDIDTTVRNQLNGITDGFQQLMGNVIQSATRGGRQLARDDYPARQSAAL